MERSYSQPGEQVLSYSTLSHMNPRTYRNHAWAQLAKSDTFYVRGSPQERDLQRRLGLLHEEEATAAEDGPSDLEAQGAPAGPFPCSHHPPPPAPFSPPDCLSTFSSLQSAPPVMPIVTLYHN